MGGFLVCVPCGQLVMDGGRRGCGVWGVFMCVYLHRVVS